MGYKAYVQSPAGVSWAYGLNYEAGGLGLIYHFSRSALPCPVVKVGRAWVEQIDDWFKCVAPSEVEAVQTLYDTSVRVLLEGKGLGAENRRAGGGPAAKLDRQTVVDYIEDLQKLLEVVRDKESVQSNP